MKLLSPPDRLPKKWSLSEGEDMVFIGTRMDPLGQLSD